jgi:hypothetical protein
VQKYKKHPKFVETHAVFFFRHVLSSGNAMAVNTLPDTGKAREKLGKTH